MGCAPAPLQTGSLKHRGQRAVVALAGTLASPSIHATRSQPRAGMVGERWTQGQQSPAGALAAPLHSSLSFNAVGSNHLLIGDD